MVRDGSVITLRDDVQYKTGTVRDGRYGVVQGGTANLA